MPGYTSTCTFVIRNPAKQGRQRLAVQGHLSSCPADLPRVEGKPGRKWRDPLGWDQ
jgi:hypothetical protein